MREVLTRKNEEAAATIEQQKASIAELMAALEKKRTKGREKKALLATVTEQLSAKQAEQEREAKRKERLDKELKDLREQFEEKKREHEDASKAVTDVRDRARSRVCCCAFSCGWVSFVFPWVLFSCMCGVGRACACTRLTCVCAGEVKRCKARGPVVRGEEAGVCRQLLLQRLGAHKLIMRGVRRWRKTCATSTRCLTTRGS